jgi:2'-5' RNA ligase
MGGIAADVVLLPDKLMMDRAIATNRRLIGEHCREIVLDEATCLPHISLAMGCMEQEDVRPVADLLRRLARETAVKELRVVGPLAPVNSRGEKTFLFEIARTDELQRLHERVMGEMGPFFRHDATAAMFCDDAVASTTLEWVRSYPQMASHEHFSPHITIGYGEAKLAFSLPVTFKTVQLALCHLGNHCTCRRILAAADLASAT